jgi:V/A-type H+-transporting ATPase subunit C
VDFANVITLVRSRVLRWDLATFTTMVLHGGQIPMDVFEKAYPLEGDLFAKTFQDFYGERISKILKKYGEHHSLDRLERALDAFLLEIISQYQNDAFQIGPILYYFLKKSAEAKNIRLIYADENTSISDLLNC